MYVASYINGKVYVQKKLITGKLMWLDKSERHVVYKVQHAYKASLHYTSVVAMYLRSFISQL